MNFILSKKIKSYIKINTKVFFTIIIAIAVFIGMISIKYKSVYAVNINNKIIGYTKDKIILEEIKEEIKKCTDKNIQSIKIAEEAEFQKMLITKKEKINHKELVNKIQDSIEITYKYYEVLLNGKIMIAKVNSIEEASKVIELAKEELNENDKNNVDLMIVEKFTEIVDDVDTVKIEYAKNEIERTFKDKYITEKKLQEEKERVENLKDISGVKIAVIPVTGRITSRYGEISSIRSSKHTGLDIGAVTGTKILAACSGRVKFVGYNGAYGYMVKLEHLNGVETWYAHASKLNVEVNQVVNAGDVIANVGSTGNSTGPHLHFEVRKDGIALNPEEYLYTKIQK